MNTQKGEASVGTVVLILLVIMVAGAVYFAKYVAKDSIRKPFSDEEKAPRSETGIKSASEIDYTPPKL